MLEDEENNIIEITNKEKSNFYEIYKILCQEKYEVGKSVKEFIFKFKSSNEDFKNKSNQLPNQMEEIINFIDDISQTFNCYYNMGNINNNSSNKSSTYKIAVEKFILNKIYPNIYSLYNEKTKDDNLKFLSNQKRIQSMYNYTELMNYLEVNIYYVNKLYKLLLH